MMKRRRFTQMVAAAGAGGILQGLEGEVRAASKFKLHYIVASAMYGTTKLEEILPEVRKTGAGHIDLWPRVHGDQREQVDAMGLARFEELLAANDVRVGCITQYPLGAFGLAEEMKVAHRLGCKVLVCGAKGPKGLEGPELKAEVAEFVELMKPHIDAAGEEGVTIAIENHANSLIESTDSMKWFAEFSESRRLGIAFAPHHLPQDGDMQGALIRALGEKVAFFYAQQHGLGAKEKLPKEQELLQMPGRGDLDFAPVVAGLKAIDYEGFTEIFMHPVPRGIPIMDTTAAITEEINRSRDYLEEILKRI